MPCFCDANKSMDFDVAQYHGKTIFLPYKKEYEAKIYLQFGMVYT